jgi:hypothetical protein
MNSIVCTWTKPEGTLTGYVLRYSQTNPVIEEDPKNIEVPNTFFLCFVSFFVFFQYREHVDKTFYNIFFLFCLFVTRFLKN